MFTPTPNRPVHFAPPAAPVDDDLAVLLQAAFAAAWSGAPPVGAATAVRSRLLARVASSCATEAGLTTQRWRQLPRRPLAAGVDALTLYAQAPVGPARPGEPLRVRVFDLAPGATLQPQDWCHLPSASTPPRRELLVLAGEVDVAGQSLSLRDYHALPATAPTPELRSSGGARLFVREALAVGDEPSHAYTVRDAAAGWPAFAPGIQRRVLWQGQGQASMLYLAQPGAQVPQHVHGHDEECLLVQGELFLDDLLLQAGDYQLAPAGTGHRITHTDTGVILYAHGDLDLQFVA